MREYLLPEYQSLVIGTPDYMAPELAEEPASTSSDLYALGVLLYKMLTGHVPFAASTPLGILLKHIKERPQPPSTINPALPEDVDEVILRTLEKEPRHRYKSLCELAQGMCCKKKADLLQWRETSKRGSHMTEQHPFKWRHFQADINLLCVRWYLRYALNYRDLEEMMLERGLHVDYTTIYRWVQHYAPEFERRCRPHLKPTSDSWRVDETYIKVKKEWVYLYRAVD